VAQALRQLDVYGHDGLPVLSPDGQQIRKYYGPVTRGRPAVRRLPRRGAHGVDRRITADLSSPKGRNMRKRGWLAAGGSLLAATIGLLGTGTAAGASTASPVVGYTYIDGNTAAANTIDGFARHANGSVTTLPGSPFPAGGAGLGTGLASQGAIQATPDGRYLLAVDAGSNQISVLRVTAGGVPVLAGRPVSSGGVQPVSIAISPAGLVYAANSGAGAAPEKLALNSAMVTTGKLCRRNFARSRSP